jgi:dTDP-4-amino-4,6-dideoxygalactose transaminase
MFANRIDKELLSLPIGDSMLHADANRVIDSITKAIYSL